VTDPSQKAVPDNTQHSQATGLHAHGWVRTRNLSNREAADPRPNITCSFKLDNKRSGITKCLIFLDWLGEYNKMNPALRLQLVKQLGIQKKRAITRIFFIYSRKNLISLGVSTKYKHPNYVCVFQSTSKKIIT